MNTTFSSAAAAFLSAFAAFAACGDMHAQPIRTLIVGGGSSHDFQRWFHIADTATLERAGAQATYTENTADLAESITDSDVLYLCNNQPFRDTATKAAIFKHAESGKGLLLVHPALWYNWKDWPEYNRKLCGGGARGHDPFGEFKVTVTKPAHPVMNGVPAQFAISDELYSFTPDPESAGIEVLATAYSLKHEKTYPIVFIVKHETARIVGITLGHDGLAHDHSAYQKILNNAVRWVARR